MTLLLEYVVLGEETFVTRQIPCDVKVVNGVQKGVSGRPD